MMLHELAALALRERLVSDPDFEQKPVEYVVYLARDGKYLQIQRTEGAAVSTGKKARGRIMVIPRRTRKSVDITAEFVVDKALYVFERAGPNDKPDRVKKCAAAYKDLLTRAGETCDP